MMVFVCEVKVFDFVDILLVVKLIGFVPVLLVLFFSKVQQDNEKLKRSKPTIHPAKSV